MLRVSKRPLQAIRADALLLPVDGARPALGGAAGRAIRAALPPEDRQEILDELDEDLRELAPIAAGHAKRCGPVLHWDHVIVASAFLHNVGGTVFTASEHAAVIGAAVQNSLVLADQLKARRLALAPIGTAARLDVSSALRTLLVPVCSRVWRTEIVLSLIEEDVHAEAERLMSQFGIHFSADGDES